MPVPRSSWVTGACLRHIPWSRWSSSRYRSLRERRVAPRKAVEDRSHAWDFGGGGGRTLQVSWVLKSPSSAQRRIQRV